MKQKQTKSFLNLSKFVKRFFVFDLEHRRAITYYANSNSMDKANDVITLNSLLAVRREDTEMMNAMT